MNNQHQQQGRKRVRFSVDAASSESAASFDEHSNTNTNSNFNDGNSDWNMNTSSDIGNSNSNKNDNSFTLNLVDELRKCQREIAGLKDREKSQAEQFNSMRAQNEQLRLKLENVELKAKAETKQMIEQLDTKMAEKSRKALQHMETRLMEFFNKWKDFHKQKMCEKGEEMAAKLADSKEAFEAKVEELQQKLGREHAEMGKKLTKVVDDCIESNGRVDEALATVDKLRLMSHGQSQQICLVEMPNCRLTLGPLSVGARISLDGLTAIKGGVKGPQQHYTNFYANQPFSVPHHCELSSSRHQQLGCSGSRHLRYYEVTLKKLTNSNVGCTFSIGLSDYAPADTMDDNSVNVNGSVRFGGYTSPIGLGQDGLFGLPACYYVAANNASSNWRIGQNFVQGDVLGCGLLMFPGGSLERQIFFTKNGHMLIEPLLVPSKMDKKLYPSVQLKGKGLIVVQANFGKNPTGKPFCWDVAKCEGLLMAGATDAVPI